jgi:hypothetical protein
MILINRYKYIISDMYILITYISIQYLRYLGILHSISRYLPVFLILIQNSLEINYISVDGCNLDQGNY